MAKRSVLNPALTEASEAMRRKKRKKARYENVLELCMSAVNLSNSQTAFKEKGLVGAVWVDWFSLLESGEQRAANERRASIPDQQLSLERSLNQSGRYSTQRWRTKLG